MTWMEQDVLDVIVGWLARMVVGALDSLWNVLAGTVFVAPDVTVLPQVQAFSGTSLTIVNSAYVLAFLWTAVLVMARDTVQTRLGPGELIPRLVIGLIAANFAMPLCAQLIAVANALTAALTSQDITSPQSMEQIRAVVTGSLADYNANDPAGFLLILIALVIAVMVAILVVHWIVRLGVLTVAVGIAPIALALHGTPQSEPAAKLWWRTVLGVLGTVVAQAVALHMTLTVFLDPRANLSALGLAGDRNSLMNLLIVLCLLWATLRIPALMRRYVTRSTPSHAATVLRVMLTQQVTRGLTRGLGRAAGKGGRPVRRAGTPTSSAASGGGAPRAGQAPLRPPAGAGPGVVGVAYPTGRSIRPYTRDEIAAGVDVYTRSLRNRRPGPTPGRNAR